jgi:hypothetical protein
MRWALALLAVLLALGAGFAAGFLVASDDEVRDTRGRIVAPTRVDVGDLRVGDCLRGVEGGESVAVEAVPCSWPHRGEVRARVQLPDSSWPGRKAVLAGAERRCAESFFFVPSETSWRQDDRVVTCIAR